MVRMLRGDDLEPGTWKYCIVKHTEKDGDKEYVYYTVGEVFHPGEFLGWPEQNYPGYSASQKPFADTPEELLDCLLHMVDDVKKSIEDGTYVDDAFCKELPVKEIDWDEVAKNSVPAEQVFKELEEKFGDFKEDEEYIDPDDFLATD